MSDDGIGQVEPGDARLVEPGRVRTLVDTGLGPRPTAEFDAIAAQVCAQLGVPMALVSLVRPDEQVFPGMAGLPEPWASRRRTPLSRSLCPSVVVADQALIVADTRTDPRTPSDLALAELGFAAYAGYPLTDAAGRVLGALCAIDTRPRPWSTTELTTLEGLAHTCSLTLRLTVATHDAASERERTTLAEDRLRAAVHRSQLLLAASQALSDTNDLEQIRATVTSLVSGELKPVYVGFTLVESARRLHRIDDPLQPVGPEDGSALSSLDADTPVARAARDGVVQVYQDKAALQAGAGHLYDELGLESLIAAPIRGRTGVLGTLLFGWAEAHETDLIEQAVVTTLAGYVGHAVERTEFLQQRITVAHELQRTMLPTLPVVAGLELAARYVPAAVDDEVGGDWYDAVCLRTPDGPVLSVTVGDITGHDIRAAAMMSQVRNMARQAIWEHLDRAPSEVVAALENACTAVGTGASGTLVHAQLRPAGPDEPAGTWSMRWVVAGHPPPVLRRADGTSTVLDGTGLLFGMPDLLHAPRADRSVVLHPGDTVLLYTDGLVERRGLDIDDGIDNVLRGLADPAPGQDLPGVVDAMITTMTGDTPNEDDVALLAVRVAHG